MKSSEPVDDAMTRAQNRELVALFHSLESPLLGFAFQMVKNEQIAEDIVQDAFIRLQTHFAGIRQPKAWLYTTVRRLAIDSFRKSRKVVAFSDEIADSDASAAPRDPVDPCPGPDEQMEVDERAGLIRVCLERLESREQTLVRLKFVDNLSYKQIAERMGMTVGHVGYSLHHALKSLELELAKEGIAG